MGRQSGDQIGGKGNQPATSSDGVYHAGQEDKGAYDDKVCIVSSIIGFLSCKSIVSVIPLKIIRKEAGKSNAKFCIFCNFTFKNMCATITYICKNV